MCRLVQMEKTQTDVPGAKEMLGHDLTERIELGFLVKPSVMLHRVCMCVCVCVCVCLCVRVHALARARQWVRAMLMHSVWIRVHVRLACLHVQSI